MKYLKKLFGYSKKYKFIILFGLLLSLATILTGMAIPYLTKLIVDNVLYKKHFELMKLYVILFIGFSVLRTLLQYYKSYAFEYTSQKIVYDLRMKLYDKLQYQSFVFYDKARTGHLMNRMVGDLEAVREFLCNGYIQMLEIIVSIIVSFSIMLTMDLRLSLILFIIVPFLYINTMRMSKLIFPKFQVIRSAFEKLTSFVQENITGIRVIKAFGAEEYEKKRFDKVASMFTQRNIEIAHIRSKYIPMSQFINKFGLVLVLLGGGYFVINHNLSIGELVAFNAYMLMLSNPLNNLNNLVNQLQSAAASSEKIFDLLEQKPQVTNNKNAVILNNPHGDLKFKDVCFKYNKREVLKHINIDMKPGTVTAVMGATGAGKSTLINLMARFYDCTSGKIEMDGINIKKIRINSLRRYIGIIMQETFLFSDTVAANISFGRPDATMSDICRAAKIAEAHDFIVQMSEGYETVIGERGIGLSGGQRQRIAIARAILFNPRILVLDDATSSLDMETEQQIQQTLKSIMKDRTTLIIAHRISAVKDADQILFMEDGLIVERGNHEQLLAMGGRYHGVYMEQYKGFNKYEEDEYDLDSAGMGLEVEPYGEEYI